jgi:hypothetical protein
VYTVVATNVMTVSAPDRPYGGLPVSFRDPQCCRPAASAQWRDVRQMEEGDAGWVLSAVARHLYLFWKYVASCKENEWELNEEVGPDHDIYFLQGSPNHNHGTRFPCKAVTKPYSLTISMRPLWGIIDLVTFALLRFQHTHCPQRKVRVQYE